jgi:hypothetical protein
MKPGMPVNRIEPVASLNFWALRNLVIFWSKSRGDKSKTVTLLPPMFRAKQVSDTEARGFYRWVRYDMLNVRPALPQLSRQQFFFESLEVIRHGSIE